MMLLVGSVWSPSTATQNEGLAQETEVRGTRVTGLLPATVPTMVGADQVLPLYVSTCPELSTAAQKETVGQETEVRLGMTGKPLFITAFASTPRVREVTQLSTDIRIFPPLSTATQNETLGHEVALMPLPFEPRVADQEPPL